MNTLYSSYCLVSQAVSLCTRERFLDRTWNELGMNCTREHTVHSVHTEHNVHTVQFELFSYSGSEFVHKVEVSRFQFTNL